MIEGQTSRPASHQDWVISSDYLEPEAFDVVFNSSSESDGILLISNVNGTTMFKILQHHTHFHFHFQLVDVAPQNRRIIATLRKGIMTFHSRWDVFNGDSTDDSDRLFTVKTEHISRSAKTNLLVSLANNKSGNQNGDFTIKGNWSTRDCCIFMGGHLIAEMKREDSGMEDSGNKFRVTIYPNVDCAFVISLFVITQAMNRSKSSKENSHHTCHRVLASSSVFRNLADVGQFFDLIPEF